MEFGTRPREETDDWHTGRMWWNGTLEAWWSRGTTDLKVASQPPCQSKEVGPVITSLHGRKQLTALSKMPLSPKNMHADEAGLPVTAIA